MGNVPSSTTPPPGGIFLNGSTSKHYRFQKAFPAAFFQRKYTANEGIFSPAEKWNKYLGEQKYVLFANTPGFCAENQFSKKTAFRSGITKPPARNTAGFLLHPRGRLHPLTRRKGD
jgi:hypothetical protein